MHWKMHHLLRWFELSKIEKITLLSKLFDYLRIFPLEYTDCFHEKLCNMQIKERFFQNCIFLMQMFVETQFLNVRATFA